MGEFVVSVNAYNDADLLQGCLDAIRRQLPHVPIQVVDGRYETFRPGAPDNSTDDTRHVCDAYSATYHPDGPYPSEAHKHRHRRALASSHDRVLFVDADERLLTCDRSELDATVSYRIRIFNALLYGPQVTYYPRYFAPEALAAVPQVDQFRFDGSVERTDALTLVHRADLRADDYRAAKVERYDREERDHWYREYLEGLEFDLPTEADLPGDGFRECPMCGAQSVTRSRVCGFGPDGELSFVEACTAGDGCYARVVSYEIDGYRYLPDRVRQGFDEDLRRVRAELMHAGNDIARMARRGMMERYEPNAVQWVNEEFADELRTVDETA